MTSIRVQLLAWLVPSFVVIAIIASTALYLSEKRRVIESIDNEIVELVRIMKLSTRRPMARLSGPLNVADDLSTSLKQKLETEESGYYFQAWYPDGRVFRQSISLNGAELQYLAKQGDEEAIYYSQLSTGEKVRIQSFTFRLGPRIGLVEASIAIGLQKVNQHLTAFAFQLIIGSLLCCFVLSIILVLVIRRALYPVQRLTEQVNNLEAAALDCRLTDKGVPREITPLVERLNVLLARLEKSFTRERQFNSDLAHELRTPLAAIRTTSEVALKWPEQSSIEDYQYIADASTQLQQLIDSLLSLARINHAGAQHVLSSINVGDIVNECISLHAKQIQDRNLTLSVELEADFSLTSDAHLLRIIFANLVSNAVEYSPENSEVVIRGQNAPLFIEVINQAPALVAQDIPFIFDRLWRKDPSRTGVGHAGLGLSIATSAAQALNLVISAQLDKDQQLHMQVTSE